MKKKNNMEDLQKQVTALEEKLGLIMVQLEEERKYRRDYGNKDVWDNEQEFRSGFTLKRLAITDTGLPVGRIWNSSGTLKIKQ
tara:strand:- start:723 stop:971 length:249 start_codon:yes stop_codon:yes gene_type:complete